MKNVILAAALAGAFGGVAATVATKMASPDNVKATTQEDVALSPGASDTDEGLRAQVVALKRANDEMALRIVALESRGASHREAISTNGSEDVAELQQQIADLAAALKNPQSAQSAGLRSMVATAMEEVRTMESEERQIEREKREVDRIVERMDEYAQKLGLDAVQKQSMQAALIDENSRRNALFATMRDGNMDRGEIRTAFGTLRDETTAKLGHILNPTQLEDYQKMTNDGGGRGNFGGNFGGGNFGGGDGGGGRRGGRGN